MNGYILTPRATVWAKNTKTKTSLSLFTNKSPFRVPAGRVNWLTLAMAESWTDSSVCSQGQAGTGCNPCCLYLALTLSFLLVLLPQITSRPSRLVSAAAPWSSLTNEGFCWSQLTNQRPWLNFIHSSWNSYISYEFHLKFVWNVRISAKTYNN